MNDNSPSTAGRRHQSLAGSIAVVSAALLVALGAPPKPVVAAGEGQPLAATGKRPLLMVHYMAWYASKPVSGAWGWHWTMNRFDPDKSDKAGNEGAARQEAASRFRPLIGLYDSGDPDALRCQVALMKLAGIDGVICDWYGDDDLYDYRSIDRNIQRLLPILREAGLKFALCYENQVVPNAIRAGKLPSADALAHTEATLRRAQERYFTLPEYVRLDGGRPLLLSFGTPYYNDSEWASIFATLAVKPIYVTENDRREPTASQGGFDWPAPGGGWEKAQREQDAFYTRATNWPTFIPAAFPRFADIYAQAGVGPSYGEIPDRAGKAYEETLTRALQSGASVVQLVTWNDWGEGTQIEPSEEFGYRDLQTTLRLRTRFIDPKFAGNADNLPLPVRWYRLRKAKEGSPGAARRLDDVYLLLVSGKTAEARRVLDSIAAGK